MTKITKYCYVDVYGWTKEEIKQAAEMFKEAVGAVRIGNLEVLYKYRYLLCDNEDSKIWVDNDCTLENSGVITQLTKSDFFPDIAGSNSPKNASTTCPIQSLKDADKALLEAQKAYEKALNDVRQALGDDWVVERKEHVVERVAEHGQEDMSDPSNWKPGDLIECLVDCRGGGFTANKTYIYSGKDEYGNCGIVEDDKGSNNNGWLYGNFKWHSRPNN